MSVYVQDDKKPKAVTCLDWNIAEQKEDKKRWDLKKKNEKVRKPVETETEREKGRERGERKEGGAIWQKDQVKAKWEEGRKERGKDQADLITFIIK